MAPTGRMHIRNVWAWNFDQEFDAFLGAAASAGAIVALDTEFPGVVHDGPRGVREERAEEYEALRGSVDLLQPIQLGLAVACPDASLEDLAIQGIWSFNLRFDLSEDLHTEESVAFLATAGIDFPRHAREGVDAELFGSRLAGSPLIGPAAPWWLTFAGFYDLGYLVKMLTQGPQRLPHSFEGFQTLLGTYCPRRHELRNWLPHGSLQNLAREYGVRRSGSAHTAGSDALVTLELFHKVLKPVQESLAIATPSLVGSRFVVPPPGLLPPGLLPPPGLSPPGLAAVASPALSKPRCTASANVWASSARWAMHCTASSTCRAKGCTAPSKIWGAAAREAATEARSAVGRLPAAAAA